MTSPDESKISLINSAFFSKSDSRSCSVENASRIIYFHSGSSHWVSFCCVVLRLDGQIQQERRIISSRMWSSCRSIVRQQWIVLREKCRHRWTPKILRNKSELPRILVWNSQVTSYRVFAISFADASVCIVPKEGKIARKQNKVTISYFIH